MTSKNIRNLTRSVCLAAALLTTGIMSIEAYAHSVRWPQNTCRVALSGHCKKAKPVNISMIR